MPKDNPQTPWPVITIDGEELEVRFTMRVVYRASRQGINLGELTAGTRAIANRADLFALCVAHNYEDKGLVAPKGEDWFTKFSTITEANPMTVALFQAISVSKLAPAPGKPATAPATTRELTN